ncbi:MAG: hypothetical protein WCA44_05050, partial [Acidobacteriaceae bacterium]
CKPFQTANSYALHGGEVGFLSTSGIFDCTRDGANSAILARVNQFDGYVEDKAYKLWLDDGNGGPPATLKTPQRPYTRGQCEELMERKVAELKAW